MNTKHLTSLLARVIAAGLFLAPAMAFADTTASADLPARQLALRGSVPVAAAGPYVQLGTYQMQVFAKLGRAATTLPDGSWLYPNFNVDGSTAAGTLVVRFQRGRVSELALVTPAVALALSASAKKGDQNIVATNP